DPVVLAVVDILDVPEIGGGGGAAGVPRDIPEEAEGGDRGASAGSHSTGGDHPLGIGEGEQAYGGAGAVRGVYDGAGGTARDARDLDRFQVIADVDPVADVEPDG